jgi:hypothetical protein
MAASGAWFVTHLSYVTVSRVITHHRNPGHLPSICRLCYHGGRRCVFLAASLGVESPRLAWLAWPPLCRNFHGVRP